MPQSNNKFVAPYWANVDLTGTGQVFYRQTNDAAIVARSTKEIKSAFPLSQDTYITNVLIVTWYGVGYYRKQTNLVRLFVSMHSLQNSLQTLQWYITCVCTYTYTMHVKYYVPTKSLSNLKAP